MTSLSKTLQLALLTSLLMLSGCVKYSFRGALPSSIKTIAIPFFEDKARVKWVGLQEKLSEQVATAFLEDNTLQVITDEESSDLLLSGTIVDVRTQAVSISQDEDVEQEQIVVVVKIECMNQALGKPLWNGQLRDFAEVDGDAGTDEIEAAIDIAIEKLVSEIVDRTIAAW
ncbi:MAG: LPS assembly lipoprotein LptE [Calditrichota bacterium]